MYARPKGGVVPRVVSTETYELPCAPQGDNMDPEVRAQIQSNIRVIYEPALTPYIHIATCRGTDSTFIAFLVIHSNLLKTVWNPNLLAGDAKPTRAAAMISLLESTEDRIRDMLVKKNKSGKNDARQTKQTQKFLSAKGQRGRSMPPPSDAASFSENGSCDYSIKPKEREKSFLPWRRTSAARSESIYTQTGR